MYINEKSELEGFMSNRRIKNKIQSGIVMASLMSGGATFAQNVAPPTPTASTSDDRMEEVVVTGIRASIKQSIDSKRDSVNVVDFLTAQDIGKFPDNNLSEALQRVPGVTINRSETGEGKKINVRGLGPEFSRTIINGGSGINGFDYTLLPSEMFTQVSVEKSPTASSQEGALAGVVRPLLTQSRAIVVRGSPGTAGADCQLRVCTARSRRPAARRRCGAAITTGSLDRSGMWSCLSRTLRTDREIPLVSSGGEQEPCQKFRTS